MVSILEASSGNKLFCEVFPKQCALYRGWSRLGLPIHPRRNSNRHADQLPVPPRPAPPTICTGRLWQLSGLASVWWTGCVSRQVFMNGIFDESRIVGLREMVSFFVLDAESWH